MTILLVISAAVIAILQELVENVVLAWKYVRRLQRRRREDRAIWQKADRSPQESYPSDPFAGNTGGRS
ncbi:hypothetical protein GCM10010260_58820 [Streptomyces filipinensis]|uniref:Uncharacterized protein n=1 Tax=Streptomyces filipinensis TaxID=66887 RepID=A0A918IFV8_9ACTN|nr:hypothetical protein GCM10010260_58820 [Streptomyces filipinensis]